MVLLSKGDNTKEILVKKFIKFNLDFYTAKTVGRNFVELCDKLKTSNHLRSPEQKVKKGISANFNKECECVIY